MLLQNNCINNGLTNGLKHKKDKKVGKTALYVKIKKRRETRAERLIGVHTQNIPYLSTVTTQHKTKAHKALMRIRHLFMRIKMRRCAGATGAY